MSTAIGDAASVPNDSSSSSSFWRTNPALTRSGPICQAFSTLRSTSQLCSSYSISLRSRGSISSAVRAAPATSLSSAFSASSCCDVSASPASARWELPYAPTDSASWAAPRLTAAAGLFSSWATPAVSVPSCAILSLCRSNPSVERSRSTTVSNIERAAEGLRPTRPLRFCTWPRSGS